MLKININKSKRVLGWRPVWGINKTIKKTNEWYQEYYANSNSESVTKITMSQIEQYQTDASKLWIKS